MPHFPRYAFLSLVGFVALSVGATSTLAEESLRAQITPLVQAGLTNRDAASNPLPRLLILMPLLVSGPSGPSAEMSNFIEGAGEVAAPMGRAS